MLSMRSQSMFDLEELFREEQLVSYREQHVKAEEAQA